MNTPGKSTPQRKSPPGGQAGPSLDYMEMLRLCRKYAWVIIACFLIGVVASVFYALSQTAIYSAQSTILVPDKANKIANLNEIGATDTRSGDLLKTYEQLLQTQDMNLRVVKSLHLESDPEFLPAGMAVPVPPDAAANIFGGMVDVRIRNGTRLIDISVEHRSPAMAQKLANEFANQAIRQDVDMSIGGAMQFSKQLEDRIQEVGDEAKALDQAVEDYREKTHGVSVDAQQQETIDATLQELNKAKIDAHSQVLALKQRYLEEYPPLMQAEQAAAALDEQFAKQEDAAMALRRQSIEYRDLQAQADAKHLQYNSLLETLNSSQASEKVEMPSISVAASAQLPLAPIRPNKTKMVLMGAFGGLMAGLALVAAIYFLDPSVKSVREVENLLSLPVLAPIPVLPEDEVRKSRIPTHTDPKSLVAESFRSLRASLFLRDKAQTNRTLLVSSAIPGEGKTFSSVNLAIALAQAGNRTLVIDADLRRSTLLSYLDPAMQERRPLGLTDVLGGKISLAAAILKTPVENLSVLAAGTRTQSCAELLSGAGLTELLAEAARDFDRIVIDSAPLNTVSDTLLIVQKVDAIILVMRAGMTPLSESKAALAKFAKSGVEPMGVVLNHTPPHGMQTYDYDYN